MQRILFVIAGIAASATTALYPAQAAAREPIELSCPQTVVSPEAQPRLDAGEKPVVVKSWYEPGLVNPKGFCTITVSPDGTKLFQNYNEATSAGPIPVRFQFHPVGLDVYAGPKGLPFGSGQPDMTCWAPGDDRESVVDCTISLAENSGLFIRQIEGHGVETVTRVRIDPKMMFGTGLKEQSRFVHFSPNYGSNEFLMFTSSGVNYEPNTPNCSADIWENTITKVLVSTGPINAGTVQPTATDDFRGPDASLLPPSADEIQPVVARLSVDIDTGSEAAIRRIMSNEAVQVDITTACEGTKTKAYLTEVARLMGQIYDVLKPRMLRQ